MRTLSLIVAMLLLIATPARGMEYVTAKLPGGQKQLVGKLLVTAQDGGLLLVTADGVLWTVEPDQIVEHHHDATVFKPLTAAELTKQLLAEFPAGFEVYPTTHYLICHNTSRGYAQWCGALYERLYAAFNNYWTRKGFTLSEPEFPLVALVFADQASYTKYLKSELGENANVIMGYYSLKSNRVNMYDLTGVEALRQAGDRHGSALQINQMLARPDAELMVATIVHEATHQIAFNCGLQTRYADVPLWISEGIAVYFETPDLANAKGWRTVGAINRSRLTQFRQYLANRPADSLVSLICDDKRMRDPRQALDAYAEAWALNYFLLRQHAPQYLAYMQVLSAKSPLVWDDPAGRLKQFKAAFGDETDKLDAEFLKFMQKVR